MGKKDDRKPKVQSEKQFLKEQKIQVEARYSRLNQLEAVIREALRTGQVRRGEE